MALINGVSTFNCTLMRSRVTHDVGLIDINYLKR